MTSIDISHLVCISYNASIHQFVLRRKTAAVPWWVRVRRPCLNVTWICLPPRPPRPPARPTNVSAWVISSWASGARAAAATSWSPRSESRSKLILYVLIVVIKIWVTIGSGNGLLPSLPEPMLTSHQGYSGESNLTRCALQRLHFYNYRHISQGPMCQHKTNKQCSTLHHFGIILFNSLAPGRFERTMRKIIFKFILMIGGWGIFCKIAFK